MLNIRTTEVSDLRRPQSRGAGCLARRACWDPASKGSEVSWARRPNERATVPNPRVLHRALLLDVGIFCIVLCICQR
eukprot:6769891-Alexandrium_andersonii.AAC.1